MRNLREPLEIAILIYPSVQMAAVLGLTDLLHFADRLTRKRMGDDIPVLRVSHVQPATVAWGIERSLDTIPGDTGTPAFIVIPPFLELPGAEGFSNHLVAWLRELHRRGTVLASVCGGTFLLAQTGLIGTGAATTHYSLVEEISQRFPDLDVDADQILIDNGTIISAGGFMAWMDLGLHLVERTLGPVAMLDTAKYLLIDPPRREQRFYQVFSPKVEHGDEAVLKTQSWLAEEPPRLVSTSEMASRSSLEIRTFTRRFLKATGLKPQEYCQHLRIARARELLSERQGSVQSVAWEVGYDDLGSFRSAFMKLTGLNPIDYRKRFGIG